MINVLHVSDKLSIDGKSIHGVTQCFGMWAPRFDPDRFHVKVASLRRRDVGGEYLEGLGIEVFHLEKGRFDPTTLAAMVRLLRAERIDILHLHGYGSWTFGRMAGLICRVPTVAHEHMVDPGIPWYQKAVDRLLSRTGAHAIAVSEAVKVFMVNARGLPPAAVEVIHNGIDLTAFASSPDGRGVELRRKLDIPAGDALVGTVGRLHPIKGHRYFIEAAELILRERSDVTFLISGEGDSRGELEQRVAERELGGRVRFLGYYEDLKGLLSSLDIKVLASLSEGMPLTLLEAMAAGCAVVSTRVGGVGEVIDHERDGYLVQPRDPQALAQAILPLLRDRTLCREMQQRALARAARHDVAHTVRSMERCYDEILGRRD